MGWTLLLGLLAMVALLWAALALALVRGPRRAVLAEALRVLPDTVRLMRRLAADPATPRHARMRIWLGLA